jgi:ABC-type lipoprotein release transport system permease subunit
VHWFSFHGIPAFSEAQRYSYGGDFLYPTLAWGDLVSVPAMMILVSVLASLGPAVMAARMRPADALRHV